MDATNSGLILKKIRNLLSGEKVTECFSVLYLLSKFYELKLNEINPKVTMQLKQTLMKQQNFDDFVKLMEKGIIAETPTKNN